MALRRNLAPNPALANNATGWFGPSGWARTASAHASLPRTTAYAGTSAGSVVSPQVAVTAGASYTASVSVRAVSAQTPATGGAFLSFDWYNASGSYLSSAAGLDWTTGASTTVRPVYTATAPSGAAFAVVVVGIMASAQVTALLVEQGNTSGVYFDGASTSPKATWDGTAGNSVSRELTGTEAWSFTDTGTKIATAVGPTGGDVQRWAESATIAASSTVPEAIGWTDSGLVVAISYDDTQGRIRVSALGLPAGTIRATVESRAVTSATFALVRGGKVAVIGGRFARTVDDFEFIAGIDAQYRITAYATSEDVPAVITATATIGRATPLSQAWLKAIPAPSLNRQIVLLGWGEVERPSRNAEFEVRGRREPVVITDVHGGRRTTITLRTETMADGEALDDTLSAGIPLFLHTPYTTALPSMYVTVGNYSYKRAGARYGQAREWTIPLTEVAAPPASIVGAGVTVQSVIDQYRTCAELLADVETCLELVA